MNQKYNKENLRLESRFSTKDICVHLENSNLLCNEIVFSRSVQPLLSDTEYKNTQLVVQEFIKEGGIGKELYRKLQDRYEKTENWVKFFPLLSFSLIIEIKR